MDAPATQTTIRCPECGVDAEATMPVDACVYFWECPCCRALVKPRHGDCCVFCSYGSDPCPPKAAYVEADKARAGCARGC